MNAHHPNPTLDIHYSTLDAREDEIQPLCQRIFFLENNKKEYQWLAQRLRQGVIRV